MEQGTGVTDQMFNPRMLEIRTPSTGLQLPGRIDGDVLLCGACHLQFSEIKTFILHKTEHAKEREGHGCDLCEKSFTSHTMLLYHYRSTHRMQTWTHEEANGPCPSPPLSAPVNTKEPPPNSPLAPRTEQPLSDTSLLFIPGTNSIQGSAFDYSRTVFKCLYCSHKYFTKEGLIVHVKCKHGRRYSCKEGEVTLHEGERVLSMTEYESQLKAMEAKSVPKPPKPEVPERPSQRKFPCMACGKAFDKRHSLQMHAKVHQAEFLCNCCGQAFQSREEAAAHRRTHRGKLYKCPQCDFQSSINSMIHLHRQKHRQGTVACEICNCAYPDRSTLSKHMCVHDKGRPYVCCYEGCAWRFKTEMMLKAHVQAHTTRGKFECTTCGYSFRRKHHLSRHLIQMHGITPIRTTRQAPQKRGFGAVVDRSPGVTAVSADGGEYSSHPAFGCMELLQIQEEGITVKIEIPREMDSAT